MTESDDEETGLLKASRQSSTLSTGSRSKCMKCNQLESENLTLKAELLELRKKEASIAEVMWLIRVKQIDNLIWYFIVGPSLQHIRNITCSQKGTCPSCDPGSWADGWDCHRRSEQCHTKVCPYCKLHAYNISTFWKPGITSQLKYGQRTGNRLFEWLNNLNVKVPKL